MELSGKVAVIYGAAGAVGSSVARAFAREGAYVHLVGRHRKTLEELRSTLTSSVGSSTSELDVLDQQAVDNDMEDLMAKLGRLDISFNLMGTGDAQGHALQSMSTEHFILPIDLAMRGHFHTTRAAAKAMSRGGTILMLTANPAKITYPNAGGFGIACAALEALSRQLAVELGHRGIRSLVIRSAGSPDTPGVSAAIEVHVAKAGMTRGEFEAKSNEHVPLRRMPLLAEIAELAVLAAGHRSSAMTGTILNATCGAIQD